MLTGSQPVAAPGYKFLYWQDASGMQYMTDGSTVLFAPPAPTEGWQQKMVYTYTAVFVELPKVTITYVAGTGGSVSLGSEDVLPATGTPAGSLATPAAGYAFDHWKDADGNIVMYDATNQAPAHLVPLRNADGIFVATTYTAIFKALPVNYTVEHYKVDRHGNVTLIKTDTGSDYAGTTVTATPIDTTTNAIWLGYSYAAGYTGEKTTGIVMVDPVLVLKLFYTANSDTPYIIYRYQLDGNGVLTQLPSENHTGYTDDTVTTTANVPAGYELVADGNSVTGLLAGIDTTLTTKLSGKVTGDGKLVLYHIFKAIQVQYVINYWKIPGSALSQSDPLSFKTQAAPTVPLYAPTGSTVTAVPPTVPGYTFILSSAHREMYPTVDTGIVLGDDTLVLNLYYEADYHTLTLDPGAGSWAPGYSSFGSTLLRSDTTTTLPTSTHLSWAGYTFMGWAESVGGDVAHLPGAVIPITTENITLYAVWEARTDTPYVVERYQLNSDGSITKLPNLTGTGTTGDTASTTPVAPDGFQVADSITGLLDGNPNATKVAVLSGTITGDGKLKLVHVFKPLNVEYVIKLFVVDGMGNLIQVDNTGNPVTDFDGYKFAGAVGSTVIADSTSATATPGFIYHAFGTAPKGYGYLGDGVIFTVNGKSFTSVASGVVADGLVLTLYFEPSTYELTYVTGRSE